jgi:hypothetical protein
MINAATGKIEWPVADALLSIITTAGTGDEEYLRVFQPCLRPIHQALADNSDLLNQLNALQSLDLLARSPAGIDYLDHSQSLSKISEILANVKPSAEGVDAELLLSFVAKFIGRFALNHPQLFVTIDDRFQYTQSLVSQLRFVFADLISSDAISNLAGSIFDALGMIGAASPTSAQRMEHQQSDAFPTMHQWFQRTTGEQRVPVTRCLAAIVDATSDEKLSQRLVCGISRSNSAASAIGDISKMAINSFDDIRLAAIALLRAMARHEWGVKVCIYLVDLHVILCIVGISAK